MRRNSRAEGKTIINTLQSCLRDLTGIAFALFMLFQSIEMANTMSNVSAIGNEFPTHTRLTLDSTLISQIIPTSGRTIERFYFRLACYIYAYSSSTRRICSIRPR